MLVPYYRHLEVADAHPPSWPELPIEANGSVLRTLHPEREVIFTSFDQRRQTKLCKQAIDGNYDVKCATEPTNGTLQHADDGGDDGKCA